MRVFISLAVALALFSSFALPAQAQFGGLTNDLEQKAEQAIVDQVTKQVGESLGQGAPLLLDQHTALAPAPDITDFRPRLLQPTAQDLGRRLPPGDYAVPVMGFCTQYSIHAPGRGLGYKLARVQGKQAGAISALLVQGSLHEVSPYTLNADAWRIQAGVPLSQWSAEDQALIHSLIPSHEKELQGDFLQQLHATYDSKSTIKFLGMKKRIPGLPSFEAVIAMMGDTGKTIMKLEASRQILTDKTISAERLPDALFEPQGDGLPRVLPPSADPSPSPWAEVQPGVFARYTILDGNMGRNLYEFRITPAASRQGGLASGPAHSITLAGFTPTGFTATGFAPNAAGPTLGAITGMGDASGSGAALNIGYSIGQGAQALIAVPMLAAGYQEPDLCPSDKLMKSGIMAGKSQQDQDKLRKLYDEALGIKQRLKIERDNFINTLNPDDVFPTFYYHTTVNGLNKINQGNLNHPDIALEEIIEFYSAYEANRNAGTREAHWKPYYDKADYLKGVGMGSWSIANFFDMFQSTRSSLVGLGADAHINYDLPRALHDVLHRNNGPNGDHYPIEELKSDFYSFDDLFAETSREGFEDVSTALSKDDGIVALRVGTDVDGWLGRDLIGGSIATKQRHKAWEEAEQGNLPENLNPQPSTDDNALEAEGQQSCPKEQQ